MENPIDKNFYRQLFLQTILGLVSYFFINAANAYLVFKLGNVLYSDYTITIYILFFICPVFLVGTTSLLIKNIPLLENETQKHQFLNWNIVTLLKSCVIISLLLLLIYAVRWFIFGSEFCETDACYRSYHIVLDVMYLLPFAMFIMWNSSFLTAHKHPFLSQLTSPPSLTYLLILFITLIGFFTEALMHDHLLLIIGGSMIFLVLFQGLCISFFFIKEKKIQVEKLISSKVSNKESKSYLLEGFSLVVNQIMIGFPHIITLIILEWVDPHEKTLSYFMIICFIASIGSVVPIALTRQIIPYLSGIKNKSKCAVLQKLVNKRMIYSCIWLMLSLLFIFIFKGFIFNSYNINFPYALECIILYLVYICFAPSLLLFEHICLYNDMNKKLYKVSLTEALVLLILSYFLVKQYSYIGAIYAQILTEIYAAVFCRLIVRKQNIKIKGFGLF